MAFNKEVLEKRLIIKSVLDFNFFNPVVTSSNNFKKRLLKQMEETTEEERYDIKIYKLAGKICTDLAEAAKTHTYAFNHREMKHRKIDELIEKLNKQPFENLAAVAKIYSKELNPYYNHEDGILEDINSSGVKWKGLDIYKDAEYLHKQQVENNVQLKESLIKALMALKFSNCNSSITPNSIYKEINEYIEQKCWKDDINFEHKKVIQGIIEEVITQVYTTQMDIEGFKTLPTENLKDAIDYMQIAFTNKKWNSIDWYGSKAVEEATKISEKASKNNLGKLILSGNIYNILKKDFPNIQLLDINNYKAFISYDYRRWGARVFARLGNYGLQIAHKSIFSPEELNEKMQYAYAVTSHFIIVLFNSKTGKEIKVSKYSDIKRALERGNTK